MTTVESSLSIGSESSQRTAHAGEKPRINFKLIQLFENPTMCPNLTQLGSDLQAIVIFQRVINVDTMSGRATADAISANRDKLTKLCEQRDIRQEDIGILEEHLILKFAKREKIAKRLIYRRARMLDKVT